MKRDKQLDLIRRIAKSLEQTNELLWLLLTPVAAKQYKARLERRKARKRTVEATGHSNPR